MERLRHLMSRCHVSVTYSDCIMRGDLGPLRVAAAADVGSVSVAEAGQLEPMDFKLTVSAAGT